MATAENVRFIFNNATDTATISDGNSNILASLPQTNLTKSQRTKVVRTSNTSSLILNLNWGGAGKFMSGVGLMRHNLQSSATWRVQLYDGENQTGTQVYDSGTVDAIPAKSLGDLDWGVDPLGASVFDGWDESNRFTTIWFTQVTALSAKITVNDATNPDGYIQASRLFMGVALTPSINVTYGYSNGWDEATSQFRTEGGSLYSDSKPQFRKMSMTLADLIPGERTGFMEGVRVVGKRNDFLVSVTPEFGGSQERDNTLQGKFTTLQPFINNRFDNYTVTFNIAEV